MNKNYWPIAIVGIIVFGMVIISVGVWIAVKNPVVDERIFGENKRVIDEHINDVLREQRFFENLASVAFSTGGDTIALQNPYDKANTPNISNHAPEFFRIHTTNPCVIEIIPRHAEFSDFESVSVKVHFSSLSEDFTDMSTLSLDEQSISGTTPLLYEFSPNDTFLLKSGVYTMEVSVQLTKKPLQGVPHTDTLNAFFTTKVEILK